jgi:predicted metal-dependent peptidase
MTTDSPKAKVSKARASLVLSQPFFASLLLRLTVREDTTCQTLWTDGKTLAYDPAFIDTLSFDEVKGVLCHETMHCAMGHAARRGARKAESWNVATDHAINHVLTDAGMVLPACRLMDSAYKGKAAEEVYSLLPVPQSSDEGNDGTEGGTGSDSPNHDPGGCGEVRDGTGEDGTAASPSELAQQEADWKVALGQALQVAHAQGEVPAGIARMVDEIVNPLLDWREVLRRFVDRAAKSDYSWTRPNRRHIADGLYLPSLQSEQLPPMVVAVDTSGSVDERLLVQFAAEIGAILEDYDTSVNVLYCDSTMHGGEVFTRDDLPVKLHAEGGGGTDFRPVFEHCDGLADPITCLIYLTDMRGKFPEVEPAYPVLWVCTDRIKSAPFGEAVCLK